MLMEQLDYNLLFRWFVGLSMDDQIWDPTVFTKNRDVCCGARSRCSLSRWPDARLATKGNGQDAKLFFMGHVVMENRNGLAVGARLTHATGRAEREAALELLGEIPSKGFLTPRRCYLSYLFRNKLLQVILEAASWLRPSRVGIATIFSAGDRMTFMRGFSAAC
jgi:hypothetical protein